MLGVFQQVNKDNILKRVADREIFEFYSSNPLNCMFNAEFRSDKNASANIYQMNSGIWMYIDIGSNEKFDCFSYVGKKFNLGFKDVLNKINRDMRLGLEEFNSVGSSSSFIEKSSIVKPIVNNDYSNTEISVVYRDFNTKDKDYWTGRYCIDLKLVEYYNTYAISRYNVNNYKKNKFFPVIPDDVTYTQNYYKDKMGIYRRKIYRPYSKFKWTSNITLLVVQGIKHIPMTGDLLIITKSMKDMLVLVTLGFNVIATNSESSFIPERIFNKLKLRFNRIFINYDNDDAGIKFSNEISSKYNINQIFTKNYSDPSDMIEIEGPKITKEYFKNKIYV